MKEYFLALVKALKSEIGAKEQFTAWFSAETLDFSRFTKGKIRQAGTIDQRYLELDLIMGQKHATSSLGLSSELSVDKELLRTTIKKLRDQIKSSHDDPFLMIHEGKTDTEHVEKDELLDKSTIVESILKSGCGLDLVGYYFGGPIYKGFANSYGQINWFSKSSFLVDTSIYHSGDKAIKQSYADTRFDQDVFAKKLEEAKTGLRLFDKPSLSIKPGPYRVYFSPSAVYEMLSMLNWGGFSRKSLEVKNSPLSPLFSGHKALAKEFSLNENIEKGVGPNFQSQGFTKRGNLAIIENGALINTLISPKTAKEYQLDHNGADESEAMCAMDMKAGQLLEKDILKTLGDGLYINNLWYLNFSDRYHACITGMTRFFCYVVKNGQAIAPFSVMRFDDSLYRIFGENLRHITQHRDLIIDSSTYEERSTSCAILPGIIAENVRFTL